MNKDATIIELHGVGKGFRAANGTHRPVLQDVDLQLMSGEIVALLGPSGSGKSTLLRLLAGLVPPDAGELRYRGQPLHAPTRGIAMVFQSFALFPWLTVQQNVELGLEARGMATSERARRAASAIHTMGLAGFEGALPRELSGGMRQRVGIARALVVEPDVLLMDEAFSALDVLTGERLRDDILRLWENGGMPTQSMLIVSHNIEEAVLMADRVLVFAANPGRVRAELSIALARPRDIDSAEVRALVDEVYGLMTAGAPGHEAHGGRRAVLAERLPEADVARMEALLERVAQSPFDGRADLPQLADVADDNLLTLAQALSLLGLAQLAQGDLVLTPLGQRYVHSTRSARQRLFGQQLLERVPLAAHIRHSVEQDASGKLADTHFVELLRDQLEQAEAERVLRRAIEWGRYGEVFEYDFPTGMIRLPAPDEAQAP